MAMPETPELDKRSKILDSGDNQVLGDFIDWLGTKGYHICSYTDLGYVQPRLAPIPGSVEELLADYFGIDLKEIEKERRAILAALRDPDGGEG